MALWENSTRGDAHAMGAHLVKNSFPFAIGAVAAAALAACGSASPSAAPPASSSTGAASAGSTTQTMSSSPTPTPVSASTAAANLAVSDQIRTDLITAGAKARGLQASDFTSLRAGMTYYAYDPVTKTYWAGGELVPSPHSYRAQVSSQDDGAYTLFTRSAYGDWTAMDEGMAGPNSAPGNAGCRIAPPPSVLSLWGWPAKSCHPNGV